MIFSHLIDEMPWLYPHPENGGQLFMGIFGHIDPLETPNDVLEEMITVIHRLIPEPVYLHEIQTEEQDCSILYS
jgi:hypothetical protein